MSGPSPQWFKRAQRGLLGGKIRLSGNHVSPSKRHVRRCWLPNVQKKALWSDALGKTISINVTPHTLRLIDKFGGLDEYLLQHQPASTQSLLGESLRRQIINKLKQQERIAAKYGDNDSHAKESEAAPQMM